MMFNDNWKNFCKTEIKINSFKPDFDKNPKKMKSEIIKKEIVFDSFNILQNNNCNLFQDKKNNNFQINNNFNFLQNTDNNYLQDKKETHNKMNNIDYNWKNFINEQKNFFTPASFNEKKTTFIEFNPNMDIINEKKRKIENKLKINESVKLLENDKFEKTNNFSILFDDMKLLEKIEDYKKVFLIKTAKILNKSLSDEKIIIKLT
jgi:hypothetical protein